MDNEAGPTDLYSLDLIPTQVDETTRQQLVQKARNFHTQYQKLKNSQFFDHSQFFIISCKYLTRWKVYVGYDDNTGSQETLGKFFGAGELPILNEDIVESVNKFDIDFFGDLDRYNVVLKPGLAEGKDFIFGTQSMWQALTRLTFKNKYIQVRRKVVQTTDNKKVELYYQKLTIFPTSNQLLRDVEYEKRSSLLSYSVQFSHYATVQELENAVKTEIVNNKLSYDYSSKIEKGIPVKMWLAPEKSQKQIMFNTFLQGCKANATFSYRLYFEGERLDESKKLSQYDILDDSLLFLQMRQQKTDWCFFNKQNILVSSCSQCRAVEKLEYFCSCKFVAYCSKQCKVKDRTYHEGRCPNNAESDVEEKQMKLNQESRRGVVGLRNLGNTCFMNSGLQCISHVTELTDYFLSNKFVQDINKDNPLGTKGQLCMAFANMLKNLWFGNQSSFSPTQLKRAIGKFQPMFSGYNQHDSGELITYLLDGLHQDLNRVKVKPYVETKDYDQSTPDHIIAVEQWESFLKRNQSQIVDLMYGQYRSVVDCPTCNKRSIQFDPFCMCSLPIINNALKRIQITYLQKHLNMVKLQVSFDKLWGWTMKQVAEEVRKQINKPDAKLFFYVGSHSSCEMIDLKRKVNQVRSEYKYRTIYVREVQQDEVSTGIKISLGNTIPHQYYKDQSFRKNCTTYRMYCFRQNMTLKQLHHRLYSFYQELYPVKDYEAEVINQEAQQQPIRLLAIASSRYNNCEFCDKKHCEGCLVPYNDNLLSQFVKKCDPDKIQFELYWRKNDKQIQKIFDQYGDGKKNQTTQSTTVKKGQTSIQDCLRLFSEPETLAEDNAYYCPNCKQFVLAKKQMQIYKAPKFLALCLKRFKRKQYFSQKYSILVDFPLQNLDLSEFVINKNLPTHELNVEQQNKQNNGPLLYDLFAISNHFGNTGGGHYTAFCKNPYTDEWYDFDDSYVSKIHRKSVVTESAYILFYKRKQAY